MRLVAKNVLKSSNVVVFFCAFLLCQLSVAQDNVVQLDPAKTTVKFTLHDVLHTIHGTFRLKSGVIHFDPSTGEASGNVIIDATSGESGNQSRDKKMHKNILQSQQYPTIEFSPKQVIGKVAPQGSSQVQVKGTFQLHGSQHDVTLALPVQVTGDQLSATTHFDVPYEAWGLKNPSTLFLRVSNTVQIDITAVGTFQAQHGTGVSR